MSFGVLSCNYKFPSKTLTYGIFVLCIQQNIKLVNEVRSFFTEFILRMRTSCAIRLARNFSIQSKQSDLSKKSDFIGPKTEKSTEKLALDMAESVSVGPTLSLCLLILFSSMLARYQSCCWAQVEMKMLSTHRHT